MKCVQCESQSSLLCYQCFRSPIEAERKRQASAKETYNISFNSVKQKYEKTILSNFESRHKKIAKLQIIEGLRKRIEQVRKKIEEQKQRKQTLVEGHELYKGFIEQIHKKNTESDVKKLYLTELVKKNSKILEEINMMKDEKLQVLVRIMQICKFGWNKYFLKRWLKFSKIQTIVFTLTSQQKGIPVLLGEKLQQITFKCEENQENSNLDPPIFALQRMNDILYENIRFAVLLRDLFINVKLPFDMFMSKKEKIIYVGKNRLYQTWGIQSEVSELIKIVNNLQANLEYIYNIIGHEEQPLFIIDENFLSILKQKQYKTKGFEWKNKAWRSNLRELGMDKIEDQEIGLAEIRLSNMEEEDDDDIFQILS